MNELAADLSEKPDTVRKWKQREWIPADRWRGLLTAAEQREIALNESTLMLIAEGKAKTV